MPVTMGESRTPNIAVIGTGALGSAVLQQLARHGFSSVLLIDPDAVEEKNLPLSPFLELASRSQPTTPPSHIEKVRPGSSPNKTDLLAEYAARHYGLPWRALPLEIADIGWNDLRTVDILCCCTDSALSRAETAFIARMLHKPVLDAAVFGDGLPEGRVSYFSPNSDAACYLCGMGEDSRATVLGYAASASMGCRLLPDAPSMTGALATLHYVAERAAETLLNLLAWMNEARQSATFRNSFVVKHAVNAGVGPASSTESHTGSAWCAEHISLTRSATCPWHGDPGGKLDALPWDVPLRDSLRSPAGGLHGCDLQLAWPICTAAVCAACGLQSQPLLRVAAVRRWALCPGCGLKKLQPLRAVHRLGAADPLSKLSPQELRLPEKHLYWLQDTAGKNGSVQRDAS